VRVFVAGATGAIGRPLVSQLLEAGHEVVGMTRSEERAEGLRARGAEAVVCDANDSDALHAAVVGARPDAIVHQLTDLPREFNPKGPVGQTGALRSQAGRVLIAAGREVGARRVVAQSISFVYRPTGDWVKDESAPTIDVGDSDDLVAVQFRGTFEMEREVTGAEGMEGLVLRYGFFYGPGTWYARGTKLARRFERRLFPVVGDGAGVFSFVHVDDAASATVAALERGSSGIYNVVDDEPAPAREWMPVFAEAVGGKPPRRVPVWMARLVAGERSARMATTMRGASNEKAKRELGWQPRWASWRQGFREGLG
jgi:nucleoside-diphosphate-sugar epimerase